MLVEDLAKKSCHEAIKVIETNYALTKILVPQYSETAFSMLVASHLARSVISLLREQGQMEALKVFYDSLTEL